MSWLWSVEDFALRLSFARSNAPRDILTIFTQRTLQELGNLLTLLLSPLDKIMRLVGKGLISLIFGLFILIAIHGLWFVLWLPLMGTSWLWLHYPWMRPIILLPGFLIAVIGHIFLILVPDPQKNAEYLLITQEWPLSWWLWKPMDSYFETDGSGDTQIS